MSYYKRGRGITIVAKKARTAPVVAENAHSHHFVIDTPSGRYSEGCCRLCGVKKVFDNWVSDLGWSER